MTLVFSPQWFESSSQLEQVSVRWLSTVMDELAVDGIKLATLQC